MKEWTELALDETFRSLVHKSDSSYLCKLSNSNFSSLWIIIIFNINIVINDFIIFMQDNVNNLFSIQYIFFLSFF